MMFSSTRLLLSILLTRNIPPHNHRCWRVYGLLHFSLLGIVLKSEVRCEGSNRTWSKHTPCYRYLHTDRKRYPRFCVSTISAIYRVITSMISIVLVVCPLCFCSLFNHFSNAAYVLFSATIIGFSIFYFSLTQII